MSAASQAGLSTTDSQSSSTQATASVNEIVHGQRRIAADTALRLARFFGTSERFWLTLQARYDLQVEKNRLGPVLDEIRPISAAG